LTANITTVLPEPK